MKKATIALLLVCTAVFAQQKGTFTDSRDKQKYKTVKIGKQTWMAENLNYAAEGSKCYEDKPANCTKYGRLYNWAGAMGIDEKFNKEGWDGSRTAATCPEGWHLPSNDEWIELLNFANGGVRNDVSVEGKKLKAKSGWQTKSESPGYKVIPGTDNFGFSALPGGSGNSSGFYGVGTSGLWWTASGTRYDGFPRNVDKAARWDMSYTSQYARIGDTDKLSLFSVRCVKNDSVYSAATISEAAAAYKAKADSVNAARAEAEAKAKAEAEAKARALQEAATINPASVQKSSFTDSRDKKTYKAVKIGKQTWMAENLNYDDPSSKCYDNKPENCVKYGRLYNWGAATRSCPSGWHLPSRDEYKTLENSAGGNKVAGMKLKAKSGWSSNIGTDDYGFSALPGGFRNNNSKFISEKEEGKWWSASAYDNIKAYCRLFTSESAWWECESSKHDYLYSVRCVKD